MTRAHFLSALVGSAIAVGVVVLLSMSQVLPAGQHVLVGYGPNPRDMVQIKGTTPYIVPPGRLFVLTAIGSNANMNNGCTVHLNVNGAPELTAVGAISANAPGMAPVPVGLTMPGGSMITLTTDAGCDAYSSWLRAWGYLTDQ